MDDSPYITLCRKLESDAATLKAAIATRDAAQASLLSAAQAHDAALAAFQASDAAVKAASDALNPEMAPTAPVTP